MAGLDPAIHDDDPRINQFASLHSFMDARVKPVHDGAHKKQPR
jgi:hypothetical protein